MTHFVVSSIVSGSGSGTCGPCSTSFISLRPGVVLPWLSCVTHTQLDKKFQTPHYLDGETEALNLSNATIHGGKFWYWYFSLLTTGMLGLGGSVTYWTGRCSRCGGCWGMVTLPMDYACTSSISYPENGIPRSLVPLRPLGPQGPGRSKQTQ